MSVTHKRIGEKHISNKNEEFTIIEYFDAENITIKFADGTIVYGKQYGAIKIGNVCNPNLKTVLKIGFIGEGKYSRKTHLNIYFIWQSILNRCYIEKYQLRQKSYIDCSVDERWHNFQVFAEWYEQNYIADYDLDKDILVKGNKIYGPDTCCFVPKEINNLFIMNNNTRTNLPIGVRKMGKSYQARINKYGEQFTYGGFKTPELAFEKYKIEKELYIKYVANLRKNKIPDIVYQTMINYKVEITD